MPFIYLHLFLWKSLGWYQYSSYLQEGRQRHLDGSFDILAFFTFHNNKLPRHFYNQNDLYAIPNEHVKPHWKTGTSRCMCRRCFVGFSSVEKNYWPNHSGEKRGMNSKQFNSIYIHFKKNTQRSEKLGESGILVTEVETWAFMDEYFIKPCKWYTHTHI